MIDFSAISVDSLFGKALRLPLRLVPKSLPLPIFQGPLRGRLWIPGSSNHGCWLGSYESEKQLLFAKVCEPGSAVWDVGANVGFYSLLAATLVGGRGSVIAVEPAPHNVLVLRKHLKINRVRIVQVIEKAIASSCGLARFRCNPRDNSTGTLDGAGDMTVETTTLDQLLCESSVPPALVKIDIEGGEADALLGAETLLRDCRPVLLVATHGREQNCRCVECLRSAGYRVVSILPGRHVNETDELVAYPD
jgi:FkbM family methyltransferase